MEPVLAGERSDGDAPRRVAAGRSRSPGRSTRTAPGPTTRRSTWWRMPGADGADRRGSSTGTPSVVHPPPGRGRSRSQACTCPPPAARSSGPTAPRWSGSARSSRSASSPAPPPTDRRGRSRSPPSSASTPPPWSSGSQGAGDDAFVSVVTLRREVYDPISAQLKAIPGTVFREDRAPARPHPRLRPRPASAPSARPPRRSPRRPRAASPGRLTGPLRASRPRRTRCSPASRASRSGSRRPTASGAARLRPQGLPRRRRQAGHRHPRPRGSRSRPTRSMAAARQARRPGRHPGQHRRCARRRQRSGRRRRLQPGDDRQVPARLHVQGGLARSRCSRTGSPPETVVDCPATIIVGKEFHNAEGEVLGRGAVPHRTSPSRATPRSSASRRDDHRRAAGRHGGASSATATLDLGVPLFAGLGAASPTARPSTPPT